MAVTRKLLKSMGLTDEQIDSVIEEHTNTVSGLKEDLNKYKEDAEKLPTVQKELNDLKKATADYDEWKQKYTDEHKMFEDYKKEIETTNKLNAIKDAYRALLRANNVDEKRLDTILKVTDFNEKELDKDGKLVGEKELAESIKNEWKDFIVTTSSKGGAVETPPANHDDSGASADARYIRERAARRHAGTYGEVKGEDQ